MLCSLKSFIYDIERNRRSLDISIITIVNIFCKNDISIPFCMTIDTKSCQQLILTLKRDELTNGKHDYFHTVLTFYISVGLNKEGRDAVIEDIKLDRSG